MLKGTHLNQRSPTAWSRCHPFLTHQVSEGLLLAVWLGLPYLVKPNRGHKNYQWLTAPHWMVMLREREIFAKNRSRNRPQEQKSVSGMVGICLYMHARQAVRLKTESRLNSSTLSWSDSLDRRWGRKRLWEAVVALKPGQIEDFGKTARTGAQKRGRVRGNSDVW